MDTKIMGSKIAEARKNANLSQAQLAQHLFISPQAVGKWERGESVPDIITVNRLAEILGVDLNYFSAQFPSPASATTAPAITDVEAPVQAEPKLSWDMSGGNWADADFSGLKNLHEQFSASNMQRCKFAGSDLSGLHLKRNNVDSCDFSGADFSGSHFQGTYLSGNQFNNCVLHSVELQGSYASGCDFSGADFTGMIIRSGGLEKNNMTDVLLLRTSFKDTHLADLVLEGNITDCSFEQCTFTRVTFRNATLTNTFFKNNNLKKIKFIDCQADRLTYEFLKSGKADLSGISIITE